MTFREVIALMVGSASSGHYVGTVEVREDLFDRVVAMLEAGCDADDQEPANPGLQKSIESN